MPDITTKSGINWRYDISGEGKVILFIHGWGVNRKIWRQQVKELSKSFKVIIVDLPGHGESGWKDISLKNIANDLDEILSNIRIDKISIVGSSLGGLVGLQYYSLYPDKVEKLVFVGAMPKFSKSDDFNYGLDILRIRKLDGQVDTSYPEIINIFFRSLFTKEERATRRFRWLQRFRREDIFPMKLALSRYLNILQYEDLRDVLGHIEIPVQFINGEEDNICPKSAIEWMSNVIPDARVNIFSKCGHFPFLSKAYEFNGVLLSFLRG